MLKNAKIPGTQVPDPEKVEPDLPPAARRFQSRVAVTTAVLAALAAISSLFSSSHLNEAMIDQIRASNQWSYYQAKGIKHDVLESKVELLPALGKSPVDADVADLARYKQEQQAIKVDAEKHQADSLDHHRRHVILSKAVTAFQISIALAAVALLVRRGLFWWISMAVGVVGSWLLLHGLTTVTLPMPLPLP